MDNKVIRCYCIGDVIFQYEGPYFREKEYLSNFRVSLQAADITYQIILKDEITAPQIPCVHQGEYSAVFQNETEQIRIIYGGNRDERIIQDIRKSQKEHLVEVHHDWEHQLSNRLILKLFDIPYQMLSHDAVFLHASYVIWKGKAILFTAPKQTGKSTQAKLWETCRDAKIINGDRALLRKRGNVWMVYGSPYCGTSRIYENETCPLGAIVILSKSSENKIAPAKTLEAYISLMDGCSFRTWNTKDVEKIADLAGNLIHEIPFFRLECTPTENAVDILEEVLW